MSTQRFLLTSLLILALLVPGASASLAQPAASPALQTPAERAGCARRRVLGGGVQSTWNERQGPRPGGWAGWLALRRGDFTTAGGVAANHIARWDGSDFVVAPPGQRDEQCGLCPGGLGRTARSTPGATSPQPAA